MARSVRARLEPAKESTLRESIQRSHAGIKNGNGALRGRRILIPQERLQSHEV
jgi:hypothetical protein